MEKRSRRSGITEVDVWGAADALLLEGRRPTIDSVRQRIGRGSPNTVMTYLDTWFGRLGRRLQAPQGAAEAIENVPAPVAAVATELWQVALANARVQMQDEFDSGRDLVRRETEAVAAERQRVASLEVELQSAERTRSEALEIAKAQLLEAVRKTHRLEERINELVIENRGLVRGRDDWATREKAMAAELANARHAYSVVVADLETTRGQLADHRRAIREHQDEIEGLHARLAEALRAVGRTSGLSLVISNQEGQG